MLILVLNLECGLTLAVIKKIPAVASGRRAGVWVHLALINILILPQDTFSSISVIPGQRGMMETRK